MILIKVVLVMCITFLIGDIIWEIVDKLGDKK